MLWRGKSTKKTFIGEISPNFEIKKINFFWRD